MILRTSLRPTIAAALAPLWVLVLCAGFSGVAPFAAANQFVRLDYNLTLNSRSRATVFIELFDDRPLTRDNFMQYVNAGKYDGTIIHRLARNFVLQGGGFYPIFIDEPAPLNVSLHPGAVVDLDGNLSTDNPSVANEFGNTPFRSNTRGTLAMAKVDGNPNSATNQWFVNWKDNGGTSPDGLDFQNGGFTVFGEVRGDGMALYDAFNTLSTSNLNPDFDDNGTRDNGPFGSTPYLGDNLVVLEKAARVDYLGGTGSSTTLNVPGTGYTIWQRDMFIDTGATLTGTGRLIVYLDRTLGVREGMSLSRPVANLGTLAPGLRNGAITVPHYQQYAEGTLAIDIRGTTVDTHYDRLNVTTTAILEGKLEVSFINEFVPVPSNSFTVLTAAALVGNFTNYDLPDLPTSMFWTVQKTATAITLSVRGGDYDHNGIVNAADYTAWKSTYGNTVTAFAAGDGNGDGKVDAADFTIWRNNFGQVAFAGGGSGGLSAAVVPEPTTGILAMVAGTMLAIRRQRSCRRL
jgi:cyclophilin family peptidyl-prolyl cis-trans isomerase